MRLESLQIGQAQDYGDWVTATCKYQIEGSVLVEAMGVNADGGADHKNHATLDKAVLAYAAAHCPHWRQETQNSDWTGGGRGENLTVAGRDESNVCVGDRWQIGSTVVVQVSRPWQPCCKQANKDLGLSACCPKAPSAPVRYSACLSGPAPLGPSPAPTKSCTSIKPTQK